MIGNESETDTDEDDILEGWSLNRRKKMKSYPSTEVHKDDCKKYERTDIVERVKRFEELKKKSSEIATRSALRSLKTEKRRSQKILKRALRDPWIKRAVEGERSEEDGTENKKEEIIEWKDAKPYLSVNKNLQNPIPHGSTCGPKTELEYKIEDCITEGDFEKAELLSDTLANREFAKKIAHAFDAKKFKEEREKQKVEERQKEKKKIRWMFDPKERWQMKGSM